jgi:hypothetical protein
VPPRYRYPAARRTHPATRAGRQRLAGPPRRPFNRPVRWDRPARDARAARVWVRLPVVTTTPEHQPAAPAATEDGRWLTRGVAGIGTASLLADVGHEVPTALLPS